MTYQLRCKAVITVTEVRHGCREQARFRQQIVDVRGPAAQADRLRDEGLVGDDGAIGVRVEVLDLGLPNGARQHRGVRRVAQALFFDGCFAGLEHPPKGHHEDGE